MDKDKLTPTPLSLDQNGHIYGPCVVMNDQEKWDSGFLPVNEKCERQPHIASVQGKDAKPHDASKLILAYNCFDDLLESCEWAYNAIKPFSSNPQPDSGIEKLRKIIAIAKD